MAADENLTTSRLLNRLAHDIDNKAATITTAAGDFMLVYDISVGKVGKVAISSLTLTDLGAITAAVVVGEDGTGHDVTFYSATTGKSWLWDESADTMIVTGNHTALGPITAGVDGTGHDVLLYSATAGKSWLWDESADKMIVTGASQFTGDIIVGVDATGHDVTFYGDTTGKSLLWDQSADKLIVTGSGSFSDGVSTMQAVNNVHDTTPTNAELVSSFGTVASHGRGWIGTVDDADGDAISYIVWTSDASYYFVKGTKAA
jgi:hypothetical protein